MSSIIADIVKIESCDSLHIVKFGFKEHTLTMMSLELAENIKEGVKVKLSIKPTHIAIGKNIGGELSYSNKLPCSITTIQKGKLLSSISLKLSEDSFLESIITKNSVESMGLKVGDEVVAIIKASELSISEVIDG